MDENKNEILEETTEDTVEETVEEAVEAEEFANEEIEEDSSEAEKYVSVELLIKQVKSLKLKNRVLSVILAIVILGIALFAGYNAYTNYNPYNNMGYPNISGITIGDMAKMYGITIDEIKAEYQLPDDVKESTYYDVIQYLAPASLILQNYYGMDFETAKERFHFPDEITENTPWGEAEATIPLSVYIGTGDELTEFISQYGLDEAVTEDTLWGEVRKQVLQVEYELANAPVEEATEEAVVQDEPQAEDASYEEISQEELEEIMAYLESATEVIE